MIEVVKDPHGGWFTVKLDGEFLKNKHGYLRRFKTWNAAYLAGEKAMEG